MIYASIWILLYTGKVSSNIVIKSDNLDVVKYQPILSPFVGYCQAQAKPQLSKPQLEAIITTVGNHPATPYDLRHPATPGIVVWPVSSLILTTVGTCSIFVNNLLVHYLFITCSLLIHNLFTLCL